MKRPVSLCAETGYLETALMFLLKGGAGRCLSGGQDRLTVTEGPAWKRPADFTVATALADLFRVLHSPHSKWAGTSFIACFPARWGHVLQASKK